jgi:hypothetical protein
MGEVAAMGTFKAIPFLPVLQEGMNNPDLRPGFSKSAQLHPSG